MNQLLLIITAITPISAIAQFYLFVFTVSSLTRICYSLLTFGRFSYQLHISSPSISVSATSVSYFYQHSESATMYLYKVSCDLLVSATLITYLYLLPKYSSQVFLLATPLYLLNFSTPNRYRISYPYQLLLSPYYTTAAQTRLLLEILLLAIFYQLLLPIPISYSPQLLLNRQLLLLHTYSISYTLLQALLL